mgnify:CR=1 FL=1
MDDKVIEKAVDRRSFLRGSALFAAAVGLGVARPTFAQEPQQPKPEDEKKEELPPDNGGEQNETLVDADGREYRVCPQCAANMYRQGRTWTCENCGYSYVE